MKRPSKKDIKAAVEKLKEQKQGTAPSSDQYVGKPQDKKPNKNRIRKQGV